MRLSTLAAALAVGLAACAEPTTPRRAALFECPGLGDVIIRHGDDDALVVIGARTYRLPRAVAASGVRYQAGGVEFWEHQGEASVAIDGRQVQGCKHNPARTPG